MKGLEEVSLPYEENNIQKGPRRVGCEDKDRLELVHNPLQWWTSLLEMLKLLVVLRES
jgi:hypothetical protein